MSLLLLFGGGGVPPADIVFTPDASTITVSAPAGATLTAPTLSTPATALVTLTAPTGSRLGIRTTIPAPDEASVYSLVVVDRDGANPDDFDAGSVHRVIWEKGKPEQVTVSYPKHAGVTLPQLEREIQVYRNGDLLTWAVPLDPSTSSDSADMTVEAPGVGWYFSRLAVDKPLTSRLRNGGFEDDLDHWLFDGPHTHAVTPASKKFGTQSLELVASGDAVDAFATQPFVEEGTGVGTLLIFVGWFQIVDFDGPALEARGLYIEGSDGTGLRDRSWFPIDDAVADTGEWQRARTTLWVPPSELWLIDPRPQAVNGTIRWDGLRILRMESLSTAQAGNVDAEEDVAAFAGRVARFVQDPANGKVPLHIGVDTPACGVSAARHVQFASHTFADTLLDEGPARGAYDWAVLYTPTTKTLKTWSGGRQVDKSAGTDDDITLTYGVPPFISYSYAAPGHAVETDVTVHGDGDEADREEGHVQDLTDVDLVLQGVHAATPGTDAAALQPTAETIAAARARPARIPEVTVAGYLVHHLDPGDLVTVVIVDGDVQIDDVYEIRRLELDCAADTLKLSFNSVVTRESSTLDRIVRRLESLERPERKPRQVVHEEILKFTHPGTTILTDPSGPQRATFGGWITKVVAELAVAAVASTEVTVYLNGLSIGAVTIPAGDVESPPTYLGRHFVRKDLDLVQVATTDASDGEQLVTNVFLRRLERT